jgi:hypothetical protein
MPDFNVQMQDREQKSFESMEAVQVVEVTNCAKTGAGFRDHKPNSSIHDTKTNNLSGHSALQQRHSTVCGLQCLLYNKDGVSTP